MRIIGISDTHNRHDKIAVPYGDVIVHAGDATTSGTEKQIREFLEWYSLLPHKYKVLVPGNHDWLFQNDTWLTRTMCWKYGITLLNDSNVMIEGIRFYGSPITPTFNNWAFNVDRGEPIKKYWDMIDQGTDILITHGPPYDILDEVRDFNGPSRFVGCQDLLAAVQRIRPSLHLFGHVHGSHGERHIDGTSFYNLSICDERYYPSNPVTVIDYEKEFK